MSFHRVVDALRFLHTSFGPKRRLLVLRGYRFVAAITGQRRPDPGSIIRKIRRCSRCGCVLGACRSASSRLKKGSPCLTYSRSPYCHSNSPRSPQEALQGPVKAPHLLGPNFWRERPLAAGQTPTASQRRAFTWPRNVAKHCGTANQLQKQAKGC